MGIRSHLNVGMYFPLSSPSINILVDNHELTDSDYTIPQNIIDEFNSWDEDKKLAFLGPVYKEQTLENLKCSLYNIFSSVNICDDDYGFLLSTPFQYSLEVYDSNIIHNNYNLDLYIFPTQHLPHYIEKQQSESKLHLDKIPYDLKNVNEKSACYYSSSLEFYQFILRMFNLPPEIIHEAKPVSIITWG